MAKAQPPAIEWSWDMLEPAAQEVLSACSVFRGGFDVEAAEGIVSSSTDLVDVLQQLVDRSLLYSRVEHDTIRFGLLDTIRTFAANKLQQRGAAGETRARHAAYFARTSKALCSADTTSEVNDLNRLSADAGNLLAAFDHSSVSADKAHIALRLDALLSARGPLALRLRILGEAIAVLLDASLSDETKAALHMAHGAALRRSGSGTGARADWMRAAEYANESASPRLRARALRGLGMLAHDQETTRVRGKKR